MTAVYDEQALGLWYSRYLNNFAALAGQSSLLREFLDMPKKKPSTMKRIMGKKHLPGAKRTEKPKRTAKK